MGHSFQLLLCLRAPFGALSSKWMSPLLSNFESKYGVTLCFSLNHFQVSKCAENGVTLSFSLNRFHDNEGMLTKKTIMTPNILQNNRFWTFLTSLIIVMVTRIHENSCSALSTAQRLQKYRHHHHIRSVRVGASEQAHLGGSKKRKKSI